MMRRARGDKPIVGKLDNDGNYIFQFEESHLPSVLKCSPKFDLLPVEYSADQYPLNNHTIKPALIYRYEWTRYGEVISDRRSHYNSKRFSKRAPKPSSLRQIL